VVLLNCKRYFLWVQVISIIFTVFPSGHMTSIVSVHPGEGSSSVALLKVSSLFSPCERFSSISWELILIRCEVKGQGCHTCKNS